MFSGWSFAFFVSSFFFSELCERPSGWIQGFRVEILSVVQAGRSAPAEIGFSSLERQIGGLINIHGPQRTMDNFAHSVGHVVFLVVSPNSPPMQETF